MSTRLEILESFAEDIAPRRQEYLARGAYSFFRRSVRRPPAVAAAERPLEDVRAMVALMRAGGATPFEVRAWVRVATPYTTRKVFARCADAFERSCYHAVD